MSVPEFDYLGPYHIERVLGRGGMGSVYKGVHSRSGKAVAIKVIASSIADEPRFRRRFASEVDVLKRLKHPNIVELLGCGEEEGLLFYSMEYVPGESLHEVLRRDGKLPWEQVIEIAIQTTSALKHAHDLGIYHRDLKPANLMISSKDQQVKLTDFGIAKFFGARDETVAGSVIGTADYMPPEQAEGRTVTGKSDLYSLGCVMYALLAGQPPFGGKSVPEVLYAVRYTPVPYLGDLAKDAPSELVELVHQLLEKAPEQRPPTALVVGNRLKAMQLGIKKKKRPDSNPKSHQQDPAESDSNSTAEIGPELTSLDLSDVAEDELKLTNAEINELDPNLKNEEDTQRNVEFGTDEQQTMLAPEDYLKNPDHSSEDELEIDPSSLDEPDTEDAEDKAEGPRLTSGGPSYYAPVDEGAEPPSGFNLSEGEDDQSESDFDWIQYASIAGLVVLLIGIIGFGIYMLQPKSADDLYAEITDAAESGDDGQLISARGEMSAFLERFPDDDRVDEIRALADEAELIRRTKILMRKAASVGGANELSAVEQAFLECMKTRTEDIALANQKLASFVSIFSSQKDLNAASRRLVELAEYALKAGDKLSLGTESVAKKQLQDLIRDQEQQLSGAALKVFYNDLILLYENKPWATDQIQRLKNRLDEID